MQTVGAFLRSLVFPRYRECGNEGIKNIYISSALSQGSLVQVALSLLEHSTHTRADARTVHFLRGDSLPHKLKEEKKSQQADFCALSFFLTDSTGGEENNRVRNHAAGAAAAAALYSVSKLQDDLDIGLLRVRYMYGQARRTTSRGWRMNGKGR